MTTEKITITKMENQTTKSDSLIDYLNTNKIAPKSINKITNSEFTKTGDRKQTVFKTDIAVIGGVTYVKVNYLHNGAPEESDIIKQARGIILSYIDDKYTIAAIAFDRFFNYQEDVSYNKLLNWSTSKVLDKIDGSLIMLWFCKSSDKWIVSTRGKIISTPKFNKSTRSLLIKQGLSNFDDLNKTYTYIFELCSRYNKCQITYDNEFIVHIGTRSIETLEELDVDIGIRKPKVYDSFKTIDDVVNDNRLGAEGYVIVDDKYNRIKCKTLGYLNSKKLQSMSCRDKCDMFINDKLHNMLDDDKDNTMIRKTITECDNVLKAYNKYINDNTVDKSKPIDRKTTDVMFINTNNTKRMIKKFYNKNKKTETSDVIIKDDFTTLFNLIKRSNLKFNNANKEAAETITKAFDIITKSTKDTKVTKAVIDITDITIRAVGLVTNSANKIDFITSTVIEATKKTNSFEDIIKILKKCLTDINALTEDVKDIILDINNAIKIHVNGL